MPICPIPVAVEPGGTYQTWSLLRHLTSPFPVAYLIDPRHDLFRTDPHDRYAAVNFPNLGTVVIGEDTSTEVVYPELHRHGSDAMDVISRTGDERFCPLLERSRDLILVALYAALHHYHRHGFGRLQEKLAKRLYGPDPGRLLRDLIHFLPPNL